MPTAVESTKFEGPAAGLPAQRSPTRFPQDLNSKIGQTEPDRHLLEKGELINDGKHSAGQVGQSCEKCETTQSTSTMDSVKQGFTNFPHQTAEFMKHIPEHAQAGAHATAEFVKHIPEHAQQGAHATAEFVKGIHMPESIQHGLNATAEFVKQIPGNMQHGAQATADFMKHLPEQAKGAFQKGNTTDATETTALPKDTTPAATGVRADNQTLQRAAPPLTPESEYNYKSPTSLEKREYEHTIDRSDAEGMHVHRACGAAKHGKAVQKNGDYELQE